ncbi:hypothetical protein DFJ73DRAFT_872903 [Zopfochytrium polystomum]|nr:hypothetical protein DFJ73DRAFT_872903 [Zopfochytrium polystomum]
MKDQVAAAAAAAQVNFKPVYDAPTHSGSVSAVVSNAAQCAYLRSLAVGSEGSFCDGLPSTPAAGSTTSPLDHCVATYIRAVDNCDAFFRENASGPFTFSVDFSPAKAGAAPDAPPANGGGGGASGVKDALEKLTHNIIVGLTGLPVSNSKPSSDNKEAVVKAANHILGGLTGLSLTDNKPAASSKTELVDYAPVFDMEHHFGTLKASFYTVDQCRNYAAQALDASDKGFCSGLPEKAGDRNPVATCRSDLNRAFTDCVDALQSGKPVYELNYTFKLDEQIIDSVKKGSKGEATAPVAVKLNYAPIYDAASHAGHLDQIISKASDCQVFADLALAADNSGFCSELPNTHYQDCRNGVIRTKNECINAFKAGKSSFNFKYSFAVSADSSKLMAAKESAPEFDYAPAYDESTQTGSLQATIKSVIDCKSFGTLALSDKNTGFCYGLPNAMAKACAKGVAEKVNDCINSITAGKASFDFRFDFSPKSFSSANEVSGKAAAAEKKPVEDSGSMTRVIDGVTFVATHDKAASSATVRAVASSKAQCATIASIATTADDDGFCDVFGTATMACISKFNALVDECNKGAYPFNFALAFPSESTAAASAPAAVEAKLAQVPSSKALHVDTVIGKGTDVAAKFDPEENTILFRAQVKSVEDCDAVWNLVDMADGNGVCDVFYDTPEWLARSDCRQGFKEAVRKCQNEAKATGSYAMSFHFRGPKSENSNAPVAAAVAHTEPLASEEKTLHSAGYSGGFVPEDSAPSDKSASAQSQDVEFSFRGVQFSAWKDSKSGQAGITATVKSSGECDAVTAVGEDFCMAFDTDFVADCVTSYLTEASGCQSFVASNIAHAPEGVEFSFVHKGSLRATSAVAGSTPPPARIKLGELKPASQKASVPAPPPPVAAGGAAEAETKLSFTRDGMTYDAWKNSELGQAGLSVVVTSADQCENVLKLADEFCATFVDAGACKKAYVEDAAACSKSPVAQGRAVKFSFVHTGSVTSPASPKEAGSAVSESSSKVDEAPASAPTVQDGTKLSYTLNGVTFDAYRGDNEATVSAVVSRENCATVLDVASGFCSTFVHIDDCIDSYKRDAASCTNLGEGKRAKFTFSYKGAFVNSAPESGPAPEQDKKFGSDFAATKPTEEQNDGVPETPPSADLRVSFVRNGVTFEASRSPQSNKASVTAFIVSKESCNTLKEAASDFCSTFVDRKSCQEAYMKEVASCTTLDLQNGRTAKFSFDFAGALKPLAIDESPAAPSKADSDAADPPKMAAGSPPPPVLNEAPVVRELKYSKNGVEFNAWRDEADRKAGVTAVVSRDQCDTLMAVASEFCNAFADEHGCTAAYQKEAAPCSTIPDGKTAKFSFEYLGVFAAPKPLPIQADAPVPPLPVKDSVESPANDEGSKPEPQHLGREAFSGGFVPEDGPLVYPPPPPKKPISSEEAPKSPGDADKKLSFNWKGVTFDAYQITSEGQAGVTATISDKSSCDAIMEVASDFCSVFKKPADCIDAYRKDASACSTLPVGEGKRATFTFDFKGEFNAPNSPPASPPSNEATDATVKAADPHTAPAPASDKKFSIAVDDVVFEAYREEGKAGVSAVISSKNHCDAVMKMAGGFCSTFVDSDDCEIAYKKDAASCASLPVGNGQKAKFTFEYAGTLAADKPLPIPADNPASSKAEDSSSPKADVNTTPQAVGQIINAKKNIPTPDGGSLSVDFTSDAASNLVTLTATPASISDCAGLYGQAGRGAAAGNGLCDLFSAGQVRNSCDTQLAAAIDGCAVHFSSAGAKPFDFSFSFRGDRANDAADKAAAAVAAARAEPFAKANVVDVPSVQANSPPAPAEKPKDVAPVEQPKDEKPAPVAKPVDVVEKGATAKEVAAADLQTKKSTTEAPAAGPAAAAADTGSSGTYRPDFSPIFMPSSSTISVSTVAASPADCNYLSTRATDFCGGLPDRVVDTSDKKVYTPLADCLSAYSRSVAECHSTMQARLSRKKSAGSGSGNGVVAPYAFNVLYEAPVDLGMAWKREGF